MLTEAVLVALFSGGFVWWALTRGERKQKRLVKRVAEEGMRAWQALYGEKRPILYDLGNDDWRGGLEP